MTFMNRAGWYCQFLESDLRTSLHRTLTFATPGKIIEVAERGGGLKDLADRQALEVGIAKGRGAAEAIGAGRSYCNPWRRVVADRKLRAGRDGGVAAGQAVIRPRDRLWLTSN
jgi:hypothetical protein